MALSDVTGKENKVDVNLNIDEKDIQLVKEKLKGEVNPVDLEEIAYQLALFKTRENRSHRVKLYNPNCEYKVGDMIYKEYPGKIPVGSKKYIELDHGVVLNVVDIRNRFGFHEIQLKYDGTSEFKQYTSYLERQKIELLLPHKQSKPCEKAEFLPDDIDPRKQQDPLGRRDFSALKKKLMVVLNKEPDIAVISSNVLLKEHLKNIDDSVFEKIKEFLRESKKSETTEFFVENFCKISRHSDEFNAYCFALNYRMQKDHKIDFQQTQNIGWGKWNLISVIYYMKKDSLISDENPLAIKYTLKDKKNLGQRRKKFDEGLFPDGPNRYYLTQREISAGAIRLRPGFFDLGDAIEIEMVDSKQKKSFLVYHYKDVNLLLGLKEIFDRYKALQSTIIQFDSFDDGRLFFTLRTTKKGTIADQIQYIPEEKAFKALEEKIASPVFVNKSMFLEASVFHHLFEKLRHFRRIDTLNRLIHKIFLEFGVKERNYEIHFLRLFHIMDLIYPMDIRLIEDIILCSPEFVPAEKLLGVFYLDSDAVSEIEEEELKRKESQRDEDRKRRDELRRQKLEQERRIKEEIRRKREERRKKREQEMWEKERLRKEQEEKRIRELKRKKEAQKKTTEVQRKAVEAQKKTTQQPPQELPPPVKDIIEKEPPKKVPRDFIPAEIQRDEEDALSRKDIRRGKKKPMEEKPFIKPVKRTEKSLEDESLTADEIKSQIELEKLKEKMRNQRDREIEKTKKKKIAYQDNGGFGGVLASKLEEIVKKSEDKKENKE